MGIFESQLDLSVHWEVLVQHEASILEVVEQGIRPAHFNLHRFPPNRPIVLLVFPPFNVGSWNTVLQVPIHALLITVADGSVEVLLDLV